MGILKGILQSKQPKIYKQITKNCLNLPRAGSLLKQTEPESAKGQSTTRGGRIGNSCVVALLAASLAHSLSWPGVPCSEYYFFLATALLMRLLFFFNVSYLSLVCELFCIAGQSLCLVFPTVPWRKEYFPRII